MMIQRTNIFLLLKNWFEEEISFAKNELTNIEIQPHRMTDKILFSPNEIEMSNSAFFLYSFSM